MTRRGFMALLAGLPIIGKYATAAPVPQAILVHVDSGTRTLIQPISSELPIRSMYTELLNDRMLYGNAFTLDGVRVHPMRVKVAIQKQEDTHMPEM